MANYWTTPKINWADTDGIGYGDLNRIEQNISANRDANYRRVQGFGYTMSNAIAGQDGVIAVTPGSCYSSNGFPIKMASAFTKNLTAWTQGNGATFGGMASAVTVAAETWYYIFVLMNPVDGSTEIMFDDNILGTNATSLVYTEKRIIGAFKTAAAGGDGSFDLMEMFSIGDYTHINPTAYYSTGTIINVSGSLPSNAYALKQLLLSSSLALPALPVKANLNVITDNAGTVGFINGSGLFSLPANFVSGSNYYGEVILKSPSSGGDSYNLELYTDTASQIYIAASGFGGTATAEIRVNGFYWERLL